MTESIGQQSRCRYPPTPSSFTRRWLVNTTASAKGTPTQWIKLRFPRSRRRLLTFCTLVPPMAQSDLGTRVVSSRWFPFFSRWFITLVWFDWIPCFLVSDFVFWCWEWPKDFQLLLRRCWRSSSGWCLQWAGWVAAFLSTNHLVTIISSDGARAGSSVGLEKLKASCLFRGIPHGRRHSGVTPLLRLVYLSLKGQPNCVSLSGTLCSSQSEQASVSFCGWIDLFVQHWRCYQWGWSSGICEFHI